MTDSSEVISEEETKSRSEVSVKTPPTRFDRETTNQLRAEHNKALLSNQNTLVFNGEELLTAYAGYLIEYLDTQLGRN